MLGKLLKYEIKAFGRIMLPLYGVLFAASVLMAAVTRLSMNGFAKYLIDKFAVVTSILFVAAVLAVMVVMVIMIIQRFYRNLLGTEGYLMFTLPVSTLEHIAAKAITAVFWLIIGGLTGVISGLAIVAIVSEFSNFVRQVGEILEELHMMSGTIAGGISRLALVVLFGITASLFKVYAAIAIGHQFQNHRVLGAALAYIGIGIFEVLVQSIPGVRTLLTSDTFDLTFRGTMTLVIGISSLQILFYGTITWWLLDRRLNLE